MVSNLVEKSREENAKHEFSKEIETEEGKEQIQEAKD